MNELEQTKKVLDVIANLINEKQTCTYRYLIYDLLGFKEDAYSELISGLTITNFLVYVKELEDENDLLKLAKDKGIVLIGDYKIEYKGAKENTIEGKTENWIITRRNLPIFKKGEDSEQQNKII